jgi:hypothetical protein
VRHFKQIPGLRQARGGARPGGVPRHQFRRSHAALQQEGQVHAVHRTDGFLRVLRISPCTTRRARWNRRSRI